MTETTEADPWRGQRHYIFIVPGESISRPRRQGSCRPPKARDEATLSSVGQRIISDEASTDVVVVHSRKFPLHAAPCMCSCRRLITRRKANCAALQPRCAVPHRKSGCKAQPHIALAASKTLASFHHLARGTVLGATPMPPHAVKQNSSQSPPKYVRKRQECRCSALELSYSARSLQLHLIDHVRPL